LLNYLSPCPPSPASCGLQLPYIAVGYWPLNALSCCQHIGVGRHHHKGNYYGKEDIHKQSEPQFPVKSCDMIGKTYLYRVTYGVVMNSAGPRKKNPIPTAINPNMMNQRWPYIIKSPLKTQEGTMQESSYKVVW
jgi:hypothetical protein